MGSDESRAEQAEAGVSFDDALTVFADPRELTVYDPDHSVSEERFVSIGQSVSGQLLVVGYTERGSKIRLIFARRATGLETLDYEEV